MIAGRVNKHGPALAPNMESPFQNVLVQKLAGFLNEIGLEVAPGTLARETFLPGIEVEAGRLIVDEAQLLYPGDLLHEAGHLAVMPSPMRRALHGELLDTGEDMTMLEVAAIAWSYAACLHLEIDPQVVFHPAGYQGKAAALRLSFQFGVYPGANQLQAAGLTLSREQAQARGQQPFPKMVKWVRD